MLHLKDFFEACSNTIFEIFNKTGNKKYKFLLILVSYHEEGKWQQLLIGTICWLLMVCWISLDFNIVYALLALFSPEKTL
jgi:hypothetical protein